MTSMNVLSSKRLTLVAATLGSFVVLLESTAVTMLASPRTANVTGSNYVIDGGLVKTM